MQSEVEVLIVGGGPTGLTLACELARRGISVRVVERATSRPETSRATDIHARSLELLNQLDVTRRLNAVGRKVIAFNAFANGSPIGRLALDTVPSPFPYTIAVLQNQTEAVLAERLAELGVTVERGIRLESIESFAECVIALLIDAEGPKEQVRAQWLVGCDGVGSTVRTLMNIPYEGTTYKQEYLVVDSDLDWKQPYDEVHLFTGREGFANVVALPDGARRARVLYDLAPNEGHLAEQHRVDQLFASRSGGRGRAKNITSAVRFRIQRRLARNYQHRRVLLAGDAAHTCTPLLGQGMNLGLHDAFNLGWKLALVCRGTSPRLIDTYEQERRPVAQAVLLFTHTLHLLASIRQRPARTMIDAVNWGMLRVSYLRTFAAMLCSELGTRYNLGSLIHEAIPERLLGTSFLAYAERDARRWSGMAQAIPCSGERAPDAVLDASGNRLFQLFDGRHVVLLFAGTSPQPHELERSLNVAQHLNQRWNQNVAAYVVAGHSHLNGHTPGTFLRDSSGLAHARYGQSPAVYVVRPDGHIGFRARDFSSDDVSKHLQHTFS